jgi:hypothetical protein
MRARTFLPLAAALAFLALAAAWGVLRDTSAPTTEHPVTVVQKARTVTVSATMPMPSAHARSLSAMLEEGAMPQGPIEAEVVTDTDCTPDRQMISRCRNEMRLADGRTIVLRHPHDMTKVPCLAPGERVHLVPTGV